MSAFCLVALLALGAIVPVHGQDKAEFVTRSGDLVWAERYAPRFSPDGLALAYVEEIHLGYHRSQRSIWVLDIGTMSTIPISLDTGGIDPAWSPDGKYLIYVEPGREDPSRGRLYITARDGTGHRAVTTHDGCFWPVWVEGGQRIAYVRYIDDGAGVRTVICAVSPTGENYEEIRSWTVVSRPGVIEWSNSGRRMAYWIRSTDTETVEGVPMRRLMLRALDLDTEEDRELKLPGDVRYVGAMRWSPGDAHVAVEATFDQGRTEIWAIPTTPGAGTEPRRVTISEEGENYYHPTWAAGGEGIICVRYPRPGGGREAVPELVLVDFETRLQSTLDPDWARPVDPSEDIDMRSSPAGTMVVVSSGAELRFLELGTLAEKNLILTEDRMRAVGAALLRFSRERNGARTPAPRPGAEAENEFFWVGLIEDYVSKDDLHSPGDPDAGPPSSYTYPKSAYNLDAQFLSRDRDKVLLIEKEGIHPGGHHELTLGGEVNWVRVPAPTETDEGAGG